MRKILCTLLLCLPIIGFAQTTDINIGEYLYPYMSFVYSLNPNDDGDSNHTNTYIIEHAGNILTQTTEQWNGLYAGKIGIVNFYISIDPNNPNAIVSNRQVHRSYDGTYPTNDKITLFILPEGNEEYKWVESQHGLQTSCIAKNIFLSFNFEGEHQYRKGVRIEKNWTDKNKKYHQTSYWVHGLSRLITFVEIDGTSPIVTEKLISFKIRDIREVTETEYNSHKQ